MPVEALLLFDEGGGKLRDVVAEGGESQVEGAEADTDQIIGHRNRLLWVTTLYFRAAWTDRVIKKVTIVIAAATLNEDQPPNF